MDGRRIFSYSVLDPISWSSSALKLHERGKKKNPSFALPETAASEAIAAIVVGAAAILLVRRTKASEANEIQLKVCEDCGGSGICS